MPRSVPNTSNSPSRNDPRRSNDRISSVPHYNTQQYQLNRATYTGYARNSQPPAPRILPRADGQREVPSDATTADLSARGPERRTEYRHQNSSSVVTTAYPRGTRPPNLPPAHRQSQPNPANTGGLAQRSSEAAHLSEAAHEFIKIPLGNFEDCARFIRSRREIMSESLNEVNRRAIDLQAQGAIREAKGCVQLSLILIKHTQMSSNDFQHFFENLVRGHENTLSQFTSDFGKIMEAVKAKAIERLDRRGEDEASISSSQTLAPSRPPEICGTPNYQEDLDHRYYKRQNAKKFYRMGRVFAILWTENAGEGGTGDNFSLVIYNEKVYTQIRRWVVVRERHGYCVCIPIRTYGNQGVAKPGLTTEERKRHAIIYADNVRPWESPHERGAMSKDPIAVTMASTEQKLDQMSRVNFGSPTTIQWNVKAMNIGKVTERSLPALDSYFASET